ncbi:MAG: hypothetical protein QME79_01140 [Bacillota bacterium]|nr:hypothetical protein [Bacillota bacterium]
MNAKRAEIRGLTGLLALALVLGAAWPAALAADPDPVAELQVYLGSLNTEPARVGAAVQAVREALAAGADPVAVQEMIRTMAREKASDEACLHLCERIRAMTQRRLNLGEILRELQLALRKGQSLEQAMETAEQSIQAQHQNQNQNQNQNQGPPGQQVQGGEQETEREQEGAGGPGGKGPGK